MGHFRNGEWVSDERWSDKDGEFRRKATTFRHRIEVDGKHPPEAGRYHLYVSWACPWAHRTLIVRKLKGLEEAISVSAVHWLMRDDGWSFEPADGVIPDEVNQARFLREVYIKADPKFSGRVTVPVLWDKKLGSIVNNESSEILRDFNGPMSALSPTAQQRELDLYPEALRTEIDAVNSRVYDHINNGVYKSGFATTQAAYERAYDALFEELDRLDERLKDRRYLCGDTVTEADWRLFVTLLRFDAVYVRHFRCNKRRIADYASLSGYLRELYQWPGVKETVRMDHIKAHYFCSHLSINPGGIIPKGPELDLDRPHGRSP